MPNFRASVRMMSESSQDNRAPRYRYRDEPRRCCPCRANLCCCSCRDWRAELPMPDPDPMDDSDDDDYIPYRDAYRSSLKRESKLRDKLKASEGKVAELQKKVVENELLRERALYSVRPAYETYESRRSVWIRISY